MNPTLPEKIVLASSNKGKLKEFDALFSPMGIAIHPQSDFNIEGADETGQTFIENSILKARHASTLSGLPAIADDSGIAVDVLHGAPGIYSARYAGEPGNDENNIAKLLKDMNSVPDANRTARFHCVLTYIQHADDPTPLLFHGQWEGLILREKRGLEGFGYDPVFYIPEEQCAAAELPLKIKNKISHRAKAMALLKQHFFI